MHAGARALTQIGCRRGEHWQGTQGHCNPPGYVLSQGLMTWLSPLRCTHLQPPGWAHPRHICTRTGLSGEGESREHRSRNRGATSAVIVRKPLLCAEERGLAHVCVPLHRRVFLAALARPHQLVGVHTSAWQAAHSKRGQCAAFTFCRRTAQRRQNGRLGRGAPCKVNRPFH